MFTHLPQLVSTCVFWGILTHMWDKNLNMFNVLTGWDILPLYFENRLSHFSVFVYFHRVLTGVIFRVPVKSRFGQG